ncbi:MAG: hypothetical protein KF757_08240 [Phycisphaeraceae bacterium]|nr:hypothetical protein [Phycisphaeraceae bacterium]MCW5762745.1 hypothetical protein [Phycisphaeraceae bacterium]
MASRPPDPVIVVPGITATYLRDDYPLPPETVWSVLRKDYDRIAMHPDNVAFEAAQPARVRSDQVFEIAYKELIAELRHNLSPRPDQSVPVYPFSYDWRQPLEIVEAQLAAFIDEVIERTRLLRHYAASDFDTDPKVSLVGHSMGGLIIAGCLDTLASKARVGKVATLASPYRGSFEAVIKVITGTSDLGASPPSSRERESARLTPALYHLIPSMSRGIEIEAGSGLPTSLYDPDLWQPSIVDTLAEYVKQHGLYRKDHRDQAMTLFSAMLATARAHRQRLEKFKLDKAGLTSDDYLCVVGADSVTRVSLKVGLHRGKPEFALSSKDRRNLWDKPTPAERRQSGDGTVPLEGAIPAFLDESNLVVVTPDDYGYWEIGDRALSRVAGFHGILPNMDMVHRMLVRFLTGSGDRHGNTWGRRIPGATEWRPPIKLEEKTKK